MSAQDVQLFCLIGLRAMGEYDHYSFSRYSDRSKNELDDHIASLLGTTDSTEAARLYQNLIATLSTHDVPVQQEVILRQIYSSCAAASSLAASQWHTDKGRAGDFATVLAESREPKLHRTQWNLAGESSDAECLVPGSDLLRLGVMRILRDLPEYTASFEVMRGETRIDCILKPETNDLPLVFVEAKHRVASPARLDQIVQAFSNLVDALRYENVIGVIITERLVRESVRHDLPADIFTLTFNLRHNDFVGSELDTFLKRVRTLRTNEK